jgi:hypothetical protein
MGYSPRYHAASLAAVFLALAVGILIGSQIGGDILDDTRRDLEASLTSDLDESRERVSELERELGRANEFGESVYPSLTALQLRDERIGLIGFGSLPSGITDAVGQALDPTSSELVAVGVVRQPPDMASLADSLSGTPFGRLDRRPGLLTPYGRTVGRQLVTGGTVFRQSRTALMSESSGQFGGLDGLLFYRGDPEELSVEELELSEQLDEAIVEGADQTRARVVGVEQVSTDPSSIGWYSERGISSVDDIDLPAGRVSLVYVLAGAQGSFGVKEGSDRLLPDLLRPVPGPEPGGPGTGRQG